MNFSHEYKNVYLLYHQERGYKSKVWNNVVKSEIFRNFPS